MDSSSPPSVRVRAQIALATAFGIGSIPLAPGTFGSLPGVALAWGLSTGIGPWAVAVVSIVVACVGTWAASGAAAHWGLRDPGAVVVDEVAGQMVALALLPLSPATMAAGFLLFRLFDIVKPFPARRLESLPGGFGIMADDLAAGLYANGALRLLLALAPELGRVA